MLLLFTKMGKSDEVIFKGELDPDHIKSQMPFIHSVEIVSKAGQSEDTNFKKYGYI